MFGVGGRFSESSRANHLATPAWGEQEYHHTRHSEIGTPPIKRYLTGPNVDRVCPSAAVLAAAFRVEVPRRQRRSDGTISMAG